MIDTAFTAWRSRLERYCAQWLRNAHDAEEVVQDVFAKLLVRQLDPGAQGQDPGVLLFRMARQRCIDLQRKRRPEPRDAVDLPAPPSGISEETAEALAALPAQQRDVLLLTTVDGLGYREAAAILGCSLGSVAALRFAAITTLRRRLQP